ncbi:DUF4915 domain-containing protein [Pseudomonas corrugata]|uniref:DUF4915 domain-containing protein n=1 Tax=Pseudomonas corrugata TaxID=47879 RepID=A0A7Y5Z987_9PSED|nr:DUF4915 domain-containing protein [Pseudomonas corrugata]NUT88927.1 DUF4915 domain-containing protein [Pseudomonas corrugata]
MHSAFENLMISSPNGGGLFFIHNGQVFRLDDINTTGISLSGKKLLRGFQPKSLVFYQDNLASEGLDAIHDIHDVLIADTYLYAVGTAANEVLQLDMNTYVVHRWHFPGENDARHINCLAHWNQRIVFSAFGDFTQHRQYKGNTPQAGYVQDLHTGERLIVGLSQPHSLVPFGDKLLLANSETMELREYDSSAKLLRSKTLDGYTRGICIQNNILYVGLSRSRNVDSGVIAHANLVALDAQSWVELDRMELPIAEIYSVVAIDDTDALPSLLAGISQRAAIDYRTLINARDEKIVELNNDNERLRQMEACLIEHLDVRNKQYADIIALTEGDLSRIGLTRESPTSRLDLEQIAVLRAQENLKPASSQPDVKALEADLQASLQQTMDLEQHCANLALQLQEPYSRLRNQEQLIQDLTSVQATNDQRIAELVAKEQLIHRTLTHTTGEILQEKQQRMRLAETVEEKEQQLEAAHARLKGVQQANEQQLATLRAALAECHLQLRVISHQLKESTHLTHALLQSHSWRWTRPLRNIRRLFGR